MLISFSPALLLRRYGASEPPVEGECPFVGQIHLVSSGVSCTLSPFPTRKGRRSSVVEQLICNQLVGGSSPFAGSWALRVEAGLFVVKLPSFATVGSPGDGYEKPLFLALGG